MENIFDDSYKVLVGNLKCPICEEEMTTEQILENSSVSWPGLNWIYFKCPLCNKYSHVTVLVDKIVTGELDGAPGPVFYPFSELELSNFDVTTANDYIECKYDGKRYVFPKN